MPTSKQLYDTRIDNEEHISTYIFGIMLVGVFLLILIIFLPKKASHHIVDSANKAVQMVEPLIQRNTSYGSVCDRLDHTPIQAINNPPQINTPVVNNIDPISKTSKIDSDNSDTRNISICLLSITELLQSLPDLPTNKNTKYVEYVVKKHDTLRAIAKKELKSGNKYRLIYNANRDTMHSVNVLHIGQVLKIPIGVLDGK